VVLGGDSEADLRHFSLYRVSCINAGTLWFVASAATHGSEANARAAPVAANISAGLFRIFSLHFEYLEFRQFDFCNSN
jgi:hypothetical protein